MEDTLTIKLAGKDYTIRPFTVGQLEALHVGVVRQTSTDPEQGVRDLWKHYVAMLAEALKEDHPEMTADVIAKLRLGSVKAVREHVDAVLIFAGLIDPEAQKAAEAAARAVAGGGAKQEPASGEAVAGAA